MQLEVVAYHKNKGTMENIREVRVNYHYESLHTNITKNAMTLFLAEMLSNSIFEEEENQELFQFIEASLQWLDTHNEISNFHLYFLLRLTKYLGFFPQRDETDAPYFDLMAGEFVQTTTLNPMLYGENLNYFKAFLGIKFDELHSVKMKKVNRQELLKSLILYFELHLQGFRKPKSLAVLNEVFS
jgi:DNA repair protein RecO (recombination protein O)